MVNQTFRLLEIPTDLFGEGATVNYFSKQIWKRPILTARVGLQLKIAECIIPLNASVGVLENCEVLHTFDNFTDQFYVLRTNAAENMLSGKPEYTLTEVTLIEKLSNGSYTSHMIGIKYWNVYDQDKKILHRNDKSTFKPLGLFPKVTSIYRPKEESTNFISFSESDSIKFYEMTERVSYQKNKRHWFYINTKLSILEENGHRLVLILSTGCLFPIPKTLTTYISVDTSKYENSSSVSVPYYGL